MLALMVKLSRHVFLETYGAEGQIYEHFYLYWLLDYVILSVQFFVSC